MMYSYEYFQTNPMEFTAVRRKVLHLIERVELDYEIEDQFVKVCELLNRFGWSWTEYNKLHDSAY